MLPGIGDQPLNLLLGLSIFAATIGAIVLLAWRQSGSGSAAGVRRLRSLLEPDDASGQA